MNQKKILIVEILSKLQKYFNHSLEIDTSMLYVAALDIYSKEELDFLIKQIITHCKFFPRIAEITELMGKRKSNEGQELKFKAFRAYNEATSAIRVTGCYRSPIFDDPIIPQVIRARFGGWVSFNMTPANEWTRKAFVDAYIHMYEHGEIKEVKLIGIHEKSQSSQIPKQIDTFINRQKYLNGN